MASFPLCEAEAEAEAEVEVAVAVAVEPPDDVALPVTVEPDVAGDVLVVGADPPQALKAPTANAVSNRILVA